MRDAPLASAGSQQPNTDGTSDLRGPRVLSWRQWGDAGAGAYDRGVGEGTWRSEQHRLVLALTPMPPLLLQIDGGPPRQLGPGAGPLSFYPARPAYRTAGSGSRYAHVCWGAELYGTAAPGLPRARRLILRWPFPTRCSPSFSGPWSRRSARTGWIACWPTSWSRPSPDLPPRRMHRVLEYIEAHLGAELTLAELAAVACLSPCHFSGSSKELVGVGPQRYTVQRRVERAKILLRHGKENLAAIAATVGFADQSHFAAAFRRETGTTPGRFRAASA